MYVGIYQRLNEKKCLDTVFPGHWEILVFVELQK